MKQISIGQVRRDLSEVVNRVAYGGERVVLTSRGRPKAALVSLEDLELLRARGVGEGREGWLLWRAEADRLAETIRDRREGAPISVDNLLEQNRIDLEERG